MGEDCNDCVWDVIEADAALFQTTVLVTLNDHVEEDCGAGFEPLWVAWVGETGFRVDLVFLLPRHEFWQDGSVVAEHRSGAVGFAESFHDGCDPFHGLRFDFVNVAVDALDLEWDE